MCIFLWLHIVYIYTVYSVTCSWAFGLFPYFVYYIWRCSEHMNINAFSVMCFSVLRGIFLGVELLSYMKTKFLVFEKCIYCIPKMARPVYIPTSHEWGSFCPHILTKNCFFNECQTLWHEIMSHCFDMHFSDD